MTTLRLPALEVSLKSSGELPDELPMADGSAPAPEPFEGEASEEPEGSEDPEEPEEPAEEEAEGDAGTVGASLGFEPLEPLEGLAPLPLPLPLPLPFPFPLPLLPGSPLLPFALLDGAGAGFDGVVVAGGEVGAGA